MGGLRGSLGTGEKRKNVFEKSLKSKRRANNALGECGTIVAPLIFALKSIENDTGFVYEKLIIA